jgi:hypothetical protein
MQTRDMCMPYNILRGQKKLNISQFYDLSAEVREPGDGWKRFWVRHLRQSGHGAAQSNNNNNISPRGPKEEHLRIMASHLSVLAVMETQCL